MARCQMANIIHRHPSCLVALLQIQSTTHLADAAEQLAQHAFLYVLQLPDRGSN